MDNENNDSSVSTREFNVLSAIFFCLFRIGMALNYFEFFGFFSVPSLRLT
jgi:hypothetical protein